MLPRAPIFSLYRLAFPSDRVTACDMAYTYCRPNSPWIYIRFKDDAGKWVSRPTSYRKGHKAEKAKADKAALKLSQEERAKALHAPGDQWDAWVPAWIKHRYGSKADEATTFSVYNRYWRRFSRWLAAAGIAYPSQFTFDHVLAYRESREDDEVGINTIIHELKFMGIVLSEAVRRGHSSANPCLKMGFQRETPKGKIPWPQPAVEKVAAHIETQPDWMQASFILGYYQAARLRQCEVPLTDIDLERRRIFYWRSITGRPLTKGDKPFAQPIATAAVPLLRKLIAKREAEGAGALCDMPAIPSVYWREFLDSLGLHQLSHHGLRTTWITRAALSRKISQAEAKAFVNHGSTAVHEIYQRLNADDVAHVADALHLPDLSAKPSPSA